MIHKYQKFYQSVKLTWFRMTPKSTWPKSWITIDYKGYPRFERIKLKKSAKPKFNLYQALLNRQSQRKYESFDITDKIGDFLYYSVGLKNENRRMYASAGGRYPCEVYIVIGTKLFHYHVKSHSLEKMWQVNSSDFREAISMEWAMNAPVLIFVSAVFPRTTNKYKNRGFLYVNQEVGAIWQTMQLVAVSLGLGTCSIGGFKDDQLNKILDLDGDMESVMSVMAVGKKSKNA